MKTIRALCAAAVLILAAVATGCGHADVSAKSDETVCVYDGSNRGSQKLKKQIFPGEEPYHADGDDEVVRIPLSNRFYHASRNREIADDGAPEFYIGYAKDDVAVEVEGQYRFRFKADAACDWYAKHGRRNAGSDGLGFNARGDDGNVPPWVKWLNENFGTVSAQTVKSTSRTFTWPELVYGNDPEVEQREDAPDVEYGKAIGLEFTRRLEASLGGRFFCGTDASLWEDEENADLDCPPIFFETGRIVTSNQALMQNRESTEQLRAKLENDKLQAEIRAQNVTNQIRDEQSKQRLLAEQAETARLRSRVELNDPALARCIALARVGLDCYGRSKTAPFYSPEGLRLQEPGLGGDEDG